MIIYLCITKILFGFIFIFHSMFGTSEQCVSRGVSLFYFQILNCAASCFLVSFGYQNLGVTLYYLKFRLDDVDS